MTFDIKTEIITLNHMSLYITESDNTNKGTILHLHGMPGEPAGQSEELHQLFSSRGYRVVSFNYPGVWGVKGYFTVLNSIVSTQQVLEYIRTNYGEKLVVYAESFGGTVVTYAAREEDEISHIFFRAPLPGMEYFTDNEEKLSQILQTLALLVQAQIVSMKATDFQEIMAGVEVDYIDKEIEKLLTWGVKLKTVTGKNDEILEYALIQKGYSGTQLEILENLPHNTISRTQWIELVTKADIFFQS